MVGVALAVLSYILRMAAFLHGRQMSWDDATMALVVCLAIPPAVFAFMRKPSELEGCITIVLIAHSC